MHVHLATSTPLMKRFELENAFLSLWQAETAGAPFGPGLLRAAGLMVELSTLSDAPDATDYKAVSRWLRTISFESLRPRILHHVALFWTRVHQTAGHSEAGCLALAAWSALASEQQYLTLLLDDLGATESQRNQAIEEMVLGPVVFAAKVTIEESIQATPRGFAAAQLLAQVPGLPLGDPWRLHASERAICLLHEAIAQRLEPIEAQLKLLPEPRELAPLINQIDKCWRYFGNHVRVERLIAEHVVDALWPAYRALDRHDFQALIAPIELAVDSLVRRTERAEEIAFLAGAVDMLAFFAFDHPDDEVAIAIYERILKLFPTHRNSRTNLAHRTGKK